MIDYDFKTLVPSWLNDSSKQLVFNDYVRIDVPLLNAHNDYNSVYISSLKNSMFRISDGGNAFWDLLSDGVDVSDVDGKWFRAFHAAIAPLNVNFDDTTKELFSESSFEELRWKMGMFVQSLMRVETLSPVSKFIVAEQKQKTKLKTQFKNFIDDNNGKYEEDVLVMGTSGIEHNFDFLVKNKRNDSYIRLMPKPTLEFKESLLFEWDDVRNNVGDSPLLAIKEKEEKQRDKSRQLDAYMYEKGIPIFSLEKDADALVKYVISA